jgi:RNA polymerase sigma-70 factor (ECF subfamily)
MPRQEIELRKAFDAGRFHDAATWTMAAYGKEILSFLCSSLPSCDAYEAYSMFAEDLWKGLPGFSWRCSMRTWAYTLARNAAFRYKRQPHRRPENRLPLSDLNIVAETPEHVHSSVQLFRQTPIKNRFRLLREQLHPDDQMVLELRVDRNMTWNDLALAMMGDVRLNPAALARESARLRKAFERAKRQLRVLAEREGLLERKGGQVTDAPRAAVSARAARGALENGIRMPSRSAASSCGSASRS